MHSTGTSLHPVLRSIVVEATEALARLDADRLEELVLSCQKLSREFSPHTETYDAASTAALLATGILPTQLNKYHSPSANSSPEMAVFGRLLALTRENISILTRVRLRKSSPLGYSDCHAGKSWLGYESELEVNDGDDQ
jgi:hypothetical protein